VTPVDELLEQTLASAAATIGPRSGLADQALDAARRIRSRRRSAAVAGVAVCAVVAVVAVSLGGGASRVKTQPPTASSVLPRPSTTTPLPVVASTMDVLAGLHVLSASATTIYDGSRTVRLHALGPKSEIDTLARIKSGYLVALSTADGSTLARVDSTGKVRVIANTRGDERLGVFNRFAISADETTIAYARWSMTSHAAGTTVRVIDASGRLLQTKRLAGLYWPSAVDASQVWLSSGEGPAVVAPMVWDRRSGRTSLVELGHETVLDARPDLAHGLAALGDAQCALMLVRVEAPNHVTARRCDQPAYAFSPDGSLVMSGDANGDFEVLSTQDLRVVWSAREPMYVSAFSWTADGHCVAVDLQGGGVVDFDPHAARNPFAFRATDNVPDSLTLAVRS
jgi:hypothetical protein